MTALLDTVHARKLSLQAWLAESDIILASNEYVKPKEVVAALIEHVRQTPGIALYRVHEILEHALRALSCHFDTRVCLDNWEVQRAQLVRWDRQTSRAYIINALELTADPERDWELDRSDNVMDEPPVSVTRYREKVRVRILEKELS